MIALIVPTLDRATGEETLALALKNCGTEVHGQVVVDQQREGFTKTVNRGLAKAAAAGEDVCILVDDCRTQTDNWLRVLEETAGMRSHIWFAGPSGPCRTPPQCDGKPDDHRRPRIVSHVSGFCLYAEHQALAAVGLLDERFVHYGSDVDWQWRARAEGGRSVWVPGVYVWHEVHSVNGWISEDHELFTQVWS